MHSMQSETIHFYATNPQHYEVVENPTIAHTETNRLCWDVVTVYLVLHERKIQKWSFSGDVSMITLACAGLFGDIVQWVEIDDVLGWNQKTVIDQTGIEVSPRRKRAQILPLLATRNALHTYLQDNQKDDFSDILTEE